MDPRALRTMSQNPEFASIAPLKICFVASEIEPLAKTGGLADVASALSRYLHASGHDVRLFMPFYSNLAAKVDAQPLENVRDVPVQMGAHLYLFTLYQAKLPNSDLHVLLIHCPALFERGALYTNSWDEHLRFLLLQRAVFESCQRMAFAPDIIHCHDWHTGLIPLLHKTVYSWDRLFARTRTVMTIHNIGYQGVFNALTANDIGLGGSAYLLHQDDLRKKGEINWLKHGLMYADSITTVSPTYAHEIRSHEGGYGLDGVLNARSDAVTGILNGVDYAEWNPAIDRFISPHFDREHLAGKRAVKQSLLERSGLQGRLEAPLIGVISRMTGQKGFDLLFNTLPEILASRDLSLIVLGSGESHYENFFIGLQQRFPDQVVFHRGYNEELAHVIEAGSDAFLMPSLYEPCGLNQMYSLKYGTPPIVRRTGGLADSVQHWDERTRQGTGIVFDHFDAPAVRWAIHTALDLFADRAAWKQMMLNGMAQDFSWQRSGAEYEALYQRLIDTLPAK
jgi:starch synthase